MWDPSEEREDIDDFYAQPIERPTAAEIRSTAEIVVFLEDEIGVDSKRLHVRFSQGRVYVQGSVSTVEQKRRIAELLPKRPGVVECELQLGVHKNVPLHSKPNEF